MSENILRALMQLFAIVAKDSLINVEGRQVVQQFLKQQLSQDQVNKYLELFDQYLSEHPGKKRTEDGLVKASVKDSVRVLRICTQINAELTQKQKFVVLVRLLEFITAHKVPSAQEIEFAATVASTFNIIDEDYNDIRSFIFDKIYQSSNILRINNSKGTESFKHISSEELEGEIRILRISAANLYVFEYSGSDSLTLNGLPVAPSQFYFFTHGSSLRSSKVSPIYYSDIVARFMEGGTIEKASFVIKDIQYFFPGGKQGLHKLSLKEDTGKLIGIMGASGAGKSTLLSLLNGTETPASGQILLNGIDIHKENKKVKGFIGFVSQDDLLIEELSVFQNLYYNAKLCFGNLEETQIITKVNSLLDDLGLFEIKDIIVGNSLNKKISGGQRKRLNFALELIREPLVLFVDEPTSGLSSRDSENIMDLLKELSLKGKLIFTVIHQPSSDIFKMFDKMLILDTGGYPIYYGNPVDSISYFKHAVSHVNAEQSSCPECGNVNPEQIFNIIETKVPDEYGNLTKERKVKPKQWNELYHRDNFRADVNPESFSTGKIIQNVFKKANKIKQFVVFTTRDVLSKISNTQYLLITFLEAPLLAFILAYLVKYSEAGEYIFKKNDNIPAYIFMSVIVALFMGLTVSAEEIIRDRKILKRESFLNLSRLSYLSSKVLILFVISAIQTLSFVLIGNYILEIHGMTMTYWLILFSTSCFANMLGLNISSAFNSAVTIYILIPIILIPQLLLSGVIVGFDKLHPDLASKKYVPLSGEVMTSKWAFEAIAVEQFRNNEYEKLFYDYDKIMSVAEYKKNYLLPTLKTKSEFCSDPANKSKKEYDENFALLKNEVNRELSCNYLTDDLKKTQINFSSFGLIESEKLNSLLTKITDHYSNLYNKAEKKKNKIIAQLCPNPESQQSFILLRNASENDNLSELVKNTTKKEKKVELANEIVQKADPIFLDPDASAPSFRSHFFAPAKKVFNGVYKTFWVNMLVIWLMSVILFLMLYIDVLRKVIGGVPGKFFRKK